VTMGVVVLLFGVVLGKVMGKIVGRILHELEINKAIKSTFKTSFPMEELLSSLLTYTIYFVAIILSLERLRLDTFIFNIIAAGIIATVVVSILLAVKDFIPNVMAGVFIHFSDHIREGDTISFDGTVGKVMTINVVETKLETPNGETIFVPNALLTKRVVSRKGKSAGASSSTKKIDE